MGTLSQDFRYGWRTIRKNPGFATVAVLVLALGIGANTAIFSVVNAVLLRPLPFEQPDRLVVLYHTPPQTSFPGIPLFSVSPANFLDWQARSKSFEAMSAYHGREYTLTGKGQPEAVRTTLATDGFFKVLGVQPMLGRTFLPSEDQPGHDHVLVLSNDFWRTRFGGDRNIIGTNVDLNGESYTIVGVMPKGFSYPIVTDPSNTPEMWKPAAWSTTERQVRGNHSYLAIGRLKPGVTLQQAKAELSTIADQVAQQYPVDAKGWGATAIPMREDLVGDVRPALLVLLGAVAFVLLIACANVANLVLAKTLSRRKEVAIRSALGANRRRLLQQVLAETVLLSLAGGIFGLIFAHYGTILIVKFLAQQMPLSGGIGLDWSVLLFTLGISLLTGMIAGLLPALRLTSAQDVAEALKQGQSRGSSESGGGTVRAALVVVEVALSLMLLIGAGLLIRTLWVLHKVNAGFDPDHVVTMDLSISPTKFANPQQQIEFYDRVLARVRPLPGVQSAAIVDSIPLTGGSHQPVQAEGHPVVPMADQPEVDVRLITPGYLSTMHIPLMGGRDFNDSDVAGRPAAVLISESMAKAFWPNENPIGKHLTLTFFPGIVRQVVGVVGDVKMDALNQTRLPEALYMPLAQLSLPEKAEWTSFGLTLAIRTNISPLSIVSAASNAVHEVDSQVPILHVQTMQLTVDESISQQRFTMLLLVAFAGLAMVLAAVGIYSVLSYMVRRRVREIGIRMALGAQVRDVLRLVVFEGMKPTLLGVVIGVILALLLSLVLGRVLSNVIYGVGARDLATFAAVAGLMTLIGLLASAVPAFRATRVDPMRTLRDE